MPPAAFRACGAIETTVARQALSALVGGGVGGSGGAGGELMILLSRIAEQDRKLEEQAAAHARLEASLASTCSTSVPPSLVWIIQGCRQPEARVVALEQQERQARQQQQERQQQERLERQERQERNMALAARLTALEERLEAGLATLLEVATAPE
jgi:hypothetical protein